MLYKASVSGSPEHSFDEDTTLDEEPTLPLMTELATATAAVAVMTLGMENEGRVTAGDVEVQVTEGGSVLILGGLAFGKVKCTGVSLLSESKFSSLLAELSSVLEAEEIPESGEVGLF